MKIEMVYLEDLLLITQKNNILNKVTRTLVTLFIGENNDKKNRRE